MAKFLYELLERSAQKFSKKIAVKYLRQTITYRELNEQSAALAGKLSRRQVKPGDRVGFFLEKSIASVITIFGILKTGAAYVPIDVYQPIERAQKIIRDCGLKIIVTNSANYEKLKKFDQDIIFLLIDRENLSLEKPLKKQKLSAEKLAYILYTSGSTGTPKGVMISHRASLAFVSWACAYFKVKPGDILSAHAPFHFDLSIFDIFAAVKAGATICLVPSGISAFPISLAKFIAREKISIWYSVPSTLAQLVLYGKLSPRKYKNLKKILFAGEVFPIKYLKLLKKKIPRAGYYNLYGPTETNVCTCYAVQTKDLKLKELKEIPIGTAASGAKLLIVNENGKPAKPGAKGELWVSGPSLMSGYWSRPEENKKVFIKKFLGLKRKYYKTGDLVQYNAAGELLFLGRRDHLVKSRGYRIELGEIEKALFDHPGIAEAMVMAEPDPLIGNQLKALVVPSKKGLTPEKIKQFCRQKLPNYMIPEIINLVEALPRLTTGKQDKQWPKNKKS